jgi:hypothetical protein
LSCALVSFTSLTVLVTFRSWQQPVGFLGTGQQQAASFATATSVSVCPQKCMLYTSPGLDNR